VRQQISASNNSVESMRNVSSGVDQFSPKLASFNGDALSSLRATLIRIKFFHV